MTSRFLNTVASTLPATVPFVGPETIERQIGKPFIARIGANENGFGPSPNVISIMREKADEIWKYADPENHDLKNAIADFHAIDPKNVAIGEGIDGLLGYTCRLFVEAGKKIVTTYGAYPTFNFHVAGNGGELIFVPMEDDHEDPQALINKARETKADIIYFSNPNNPMGTWHDAKKVQYLIDNIPKHALLILDEAYIEFAPDGTAPPLDLKNQSVLRFRTFSKAYGMAGARVGYCLGNENLTSQFDKIRNHFGMNRIAQLSAIAALEDQAWIETMRKKVENAREKIADIARENGLTSLASATNFVAVDCGGDAKHAKAVVDGLAKHGIFIRMPGAAPQSRCVRISTGPADFMHALAQALPKVLAKI